MKAGLDQKSYTIQLLSAPFCRQQSRRQVPSSRSICLCTRLILQNMRSRERSLFILHNVRLRERSLQAVVDNNEHDPDPDPDPTFKS
jgi:hypothetical protein